jgi:hypothetical protein
VTDGGERQLKQNGGGENIFIDNLYYGNIDAQSSELTDSKLFRKKMEMLAEREKELLDNLKGKELDCFEKYSEAWLYINSETNRDSFKTGFKLGAKMGFDVFAD